MWPCVHYIVAIVGFSSHSRSCPRLFLSRPRSLVVVVVVVLLLFLFLFLFFFSFSLSSSFSSFLSSSLSIRNYSFRYDACRQAGSPIVNFSTPFPRRFLRRRHSDGRGRNKCADHKKKDHTSRCHHGTQPAVAKRSHLLHTGRKTEYENL